jgi:hypothetical protein
VSQDSLVVIVRVAIAACFDVARDRDDLVWLKTNADDSAGADIGTAPAAASAPELQPDPKLLVLHSSLKRLTFPATGARLGTIARRGACARVRVGRGVSCEIAFRTS